MAPQKYAPPPSKNVKKNGKKLIFLHFLLQIMRKRGYNACIWVRKRLRCNKSPIITENHRKSSKITKNHQKSLTPPSKIEKKCNFLNFLIFIDYWCLTFSTVEQGRNEHLEATLEMVLGLKSTSDWYPRSATEIVRVKIKRK